MSGVEVHKVTQARQAEQLRAALAVQSRDGGPEYWSFRNASRARGGEDVLFQYPAMMVSPMQGALIDVLREHRDGPVSVLDPFLGSGTTMIEAMRRGLRFAGFDLNPLAVMLARVESLESSEHDLGASRARVCARATELRGSVVAPEDSFIRRWFRSDVAAEMAALRAAIALEDAVEVRRVWWTCLAEVCRVSTNARISTPKLQTRPLPELSRRIDVLGRFEQLSGRATGVLRSRAEALRASGFLDPAGYSPGVEVGLQDARSMASLPVAANLVLTSPPYGDNHTTMPYGQASFLPLIWIDREDVGSPIPDALLASSRSLDTLSLGGSRVTANEAVAGSLQEQSPTLGNLLGRLRPTSREAWQRVGSFFADYAAAWDCILKQCTPDAHLVLTLGDRTVRGLHVATATITTELLAVRGLTLIDRLTREIPHNKRIARRNEISATIGGETVLVLQRAA